MLDQISWRPGIGDMSTYGWVTVACYAIAALLCWIAASKTPKNDRRWWVFAALVMAFLCVNKQLDLQSLATDIARVIAKENGWFDYRREMQAGFVIAMLVVGLLSLLFVARRFRRWSGPVRGMLTGLVFLGTFILIRASSFHHMDNFIKSSIGGVRANHVLELGGIAIVALSALWAMAGSGKRRRR